VIYLSPYSPDFNPIELWWSQLKSFILGFATTTSSMIDTLLAVYSVSSPGICSRYNPINLLEFGRQSWRHSYTE
ncbi:MAG: hypothetical protein F6J86_46085, partial [Symploca sp. SIO1B1]|nr:hypothetical protein [Symploca sp. SIO1B1]